MPTNQSQRDLIARMKLIRVQALIEDKKLLLIDDSIVRGTQLRETTEFLYRSGAKEVHIRPACPPLLYGCKYLNFSRFEIRDGSIDHEKSHSGAGRRRSICRGIKRVFGSGCSDRYANMIEEIRRIQNFTSLRYHRLDDLLESIGIDPSQVCTYCFDGRE